jgi:L-galactose dehydrogenase
MDTVTLGRTGLKMSTAGLGTGGYSRLGLGQGKDENHAVGIIHAALDLGIDIIDTSSFYGTEEVVGKALKGRRDRVVISTKNLMVRDDTSLTGNSYLTAAEFKQAVEGNLSRLGTDYIDILHVHGVCDHQYDYCRDALVPVLHELRDEGKIRFLAVSERFYVEPRHDMLVRALQDDFWDVVMVGFNIVNQTAIHNVLPQCVEKDVGTLCIYAVRSHLGSLEGARKLILDAISAGQVDPGDLDMENPLLFLLDEGGAGSLTNACYRFNRHMPGAHVILTGTGSLDHLRENVRSINDPPLPTAVVDKLRRIFGRVDAVSGD